MPMAKSASISVTTCSLANSTSFANTGRPDTSVRAEQPEPREREHRQEQLVARRHVLDDVDRVVEQARARRRVAERGGAGGMKRALIQPVSATATPSTPTMSAPLSTSISAAAEDRAEQDREERAGLDQRVAGDQLVLDEMLRAAART